uniref:NADH-ubiquinone oxidoreductase chain 4 n=1 Tax=Thaparocleidus asoti TaxID=341077 RepID=A0A7L8ZQV1_9PLAT|nr:NADH dehydrogenase subunit 4 [Thaparocleidus asoti]QOI72775.1 NADH dehydrogenase subunit 4 [Thaparocleidus asoti]
MVLYWLFIHFMWLFWVINIVLWLILFFFNVLDINVVSQYFLLDSIGIYLSFLSIFFLGIFLFIFYSELNFLNILAISLSIFFSMLCFLSINSLIFWICYELAILFALILILYSSPYSERFLASWYLVIYVFIGSLPMLFLISYLSLENETWNILLWELSNNGNLVLYLLAILFCTKIPLPPFHSWLPVVHAEASSYVSIILSGYIMKLGLIGLFRFCYHFLNNWGVLLLILFSFSLLFFFASGQELDIKRWLAFLSLGHILIGLLGLFYFQFNDYWIVGLYCFGHGLSAFLLFYLFMVLNSMVGSRNWLIISLNNNLNNFYYVLVALALLTVSSFPPTISFFSEIYLFQSLFVSYASILLYTFYIFIGGIVPVIVLSLFLVNAKLHSVSNVNNYGNLIVMFSLCFLCFFCIFWV